MLTRDAFWLVGMQVGDVARLFGSRIAIRTDPNQPSSMRSDREMLQLSILISSCCRCLSVHEGTQHLPVCSHTVSSRSSNQALAERVTELLSSEHPPTVKSIHFFWNTRAHGEDTSAPPPPHPVSPPVRPNLAPLLFRRHCHQLFNAGVLIRI